MAGLVIAELDVASVGHKKYSTGKITFDASYPTGGEALSAGALGLSRVDVFIAHTAGGYVFEYDYSGALLKAYAGGGQAAHTHDLLFIGGITATEAVAIESGNKLGKNAATNRTIAGASSATLGGVVATTASVAAAGEVANTTDLSAVVTRFIAIGV